MKFDYGYGANSDAVKCEVCGDHNGLHIRAARIDMMGDVVSVGPAGIEQFSDGNKSSARGSAVEIDFTCEFGNHPFTSRFEFHKGAVLLSSILQKPLPDLGPGGPSLDVELPRD